MRLPLVLAFLALSACGQPSPSKIEVRDAWARATVPGQRAGAAYATIANRGGAADRLIAVTTDRASMAMMHTNQTQAGIARMRMVGGIDIPADGSIELRPGGTHIMLERLTGPLTAGDQFDLHLRFERSGEQIVPVRVEPAGAR